MARPWLLSALPLPCVLDIAGGVGTADAGAGVAIRLALPPARSDRLLPPPAGRRIGIDGH